MLVHEGLDFPVDQTVIGQFLMSLMSPFVRRIIILASFHSAGIFFVSSVV